MAEAADTTETQGDPPPGSVTHTTLMEESEPSVGVVRSAELRMFKKVTCSDRIIKNQQRGDPDLTEEQKIEILTDLLRRTPKKFLMRFGSLLDEDDLKYFEGSMDYEINFRLKELRKDLGSGVRKKKVRNRRFEALKELTETTSYFSEEEMRSRNPLLYEYYIGQYLTEEERGALDTDKSEMSLSAIMMKKMDIDRRAELLRSQQKREMEQLEETDSSSDEEELAANMTLSSNPEMAGQERQMLRAEFLRAMQLSFLSGEDRDFDYSKVDSNERYDSMDIQGRDSEDAYFDSEEPSWCEPDDGMEWSTADMGTGHCDQKDHCIDEPQDQ